MAKSDKAFAVEEFQVVFPETLRAAEESILGRGK